MEPASAESSSSPSKVIVTPSSDSSKSAPQLTPDAMPGDEAEDVVDYRPSRSLPRSLINHCRIYLEDQLFAHAIELANSLLTCGPAIQNGRVTEAFVLPRCRSGLDEDFHDDDFDDGGEDEENAKIISKLGNEESIWNCGHDFWSVLGWAFNCSVVHPSRWRWWRAWIDFMLRVLDEDWIKRAALDEAADEKRGGKGEFEFHMMKQSLIANYATRRGGRANDVKRLVKALFADGHEASLSLFTEVFPSETKDLPRGQRKRKRDPALDLENFKYGDYGDTDDELEASGPEDDGRSFLVPYRFRIMCLLSQLAFSMPILFVTLDTLFELFAVGIKDMPLHLFTAMINPSSANVMGKDYVTLLLWELLYCLLPPKFLNPAEVDQEADREGRFTQDILEKSVVSAGGRHDDDAGRRRAHPRASLTAMVEAGIAARKSKAKIKQNRRTGRFNEYDVFAKKALDDSSDMLQSILGAVRAKV
ncbi:unnamed protein product [Parascedosporium putredinis]|uniref:Uncharacterized protein n=1 Tax=Parascedosporium putredinis TaxID=1442378 RepID=A0A9P1H9K2_9PEZI|nr:unnamed protein product [Parascedosporium putredinis]CAI8003141.1 unnamed protein product [Parascedosporium putredinis]